MAPAPKFQEEYSAKLPALALLSTLFSHKTPVFCRFFTYSTRCRNRLTHHQVRGQLPLLVLVYAAIAANR